jgi:hypothetical protein
VQETFAMPLRWQAAAMPQARQNWAIGCGHIAIASLAAENLRVGSLTTVVSLISGQSMIQQPGWGTRLMIKPNFHIKGRGMRGMKGDVLTLYTENGSGNLNITGWKIPLYPPHPPTQLDLRHGAVS